MPQYEIKCGEHRGTVEAATPGEAFRLVTKDKMDGFSVLAAFRRRPYGFWHYQVPDALHNSK